MEETPPGCTTRERTVPCHQPQAGSSAPLPPSTNTARRAGCLCTAVTPPSFSSLMNTTPAAPRGSAAGDHPRQAPGSAACGWDTSEMLVFCRRLENTRYKVEMPQEQELVRKHQELHYFRLKRSLYLDCILPLHPHCPEPNPSALSAPPPSLSVAHTHRWLLQHKFIFLRWIFSPAPFNQVQPRYTLYFRTFEKEWIMFTSRRDTRDATEKKSL